MTRDDVVVGLTEAALGEWMRSDLHSDEAKMLSAIREALRWLDDSADLSAFARYAKGEWSRQELHAMRHDLSLAD